MWKRLFVPEYFCYEVINSMRSTGIEIIFYPDYPLADDQVLLKEIDFRPTDVLLRMNYYGWRGFWDNAVLDVNVIEDHSHDLYSDWALHSNADWCVASLRKTLPIPDGGILWSPKNFTDQLFKPKLSSIHSNISEDRFYAMEMKRDYLYGGEADLKNNYLKLFNETEAQIGSGQISALSEVSEKIIKQNPIDINKKKKENFII